MARYILNYLTTAQALVEVEADSEDEAMAIANRGEVGPPMSLCHQCSGVVSLGDWEPDDDEPIWLA